MISVFEGSPLPWSLMLLWGAVPGIWLGARTLAVALTADTIVQKVLRPALAIAAWIVAVQLSSVACGSFWIGMPVGMIAISALGAISCWLPRRATTPRSIGANGIKSGPPLPRGLWIGMVVATLPVAAVAFRGHFDELMPHGHLNQIAQFQNDYFPPQYLGFTNVPLRYHYGFDLVCAGVTALTRLRKDLAIDLTTIFGWAYAWCLAWVLGVRLTGRESGGPWTAIMTLFGGGVAALIGVCIRPTNLFDCLTGNFSLGLDGIRATPPLTCNIFQHPFSLGLPLALATLLTALKPIPPEGLATTKLMVWSRGAALGLFLAALAITQSVLFLCLLGTLIFTEVVLAGGWQFVGIALVVLAIAPLMGGLLFTRVPDSPSMGLHLQFWPLASLKPNYWLRVISFYGATFGLLLPVGLAGLRYVRRLRPILLLMVAGGVLIPLFVRYEYTFDIIKFCMVGAICLGISAGAAMTEWAGLPRSHRRILLPISIFLLTSTSVSYLAAVLWVQYVGPVHRYYCAVPTPLAQVDEQALRWLRVNVRPNEIVYRLPTVAIGYMQQGGIPSTPPEMRDTGPFGVRKSRVEARDALLAELPKDIEAYRAMGIVWFVVGPDDPTMSERIIAWLTEGRVRETARFGTLIIYRIAAPAS